MKQLSVIILLLLILSCKGETITYETVSFNASDGLSITADLYMPHPEESPFIVLCHQAGWSRGEYLEIAPKLNALGYNCLAIDQRSGGEANGITNETHKQAKTQKKGVSFLDAEVDINSAIDFVVNNYKMANKVILWGSSYSSALAIKIGGERNDIDGVLAFAPGEYFERFGKSGNYIETNAEQVKIPTFITSAKSEKSNWWSIFKAIPVKSKSYFIPETKGQHGSRALWEKFPEHEAYWKAVKDFLKTI